MKILKTCLVVAVIVAGTSPAMAGGFFKFFNTEDRPREERSLRDLETRPTQIGQSMPGQFVQLANYQPSPTLAPSDPMQLPPMPAEQGEVYSSTPSYSTPGYSRPPAPAYYGPGPGIGHSVAPVQPMVLYHRVEYEDLDNIAPNAITKIVAVADPCARCERGCAPQCVYVQICVPCYGHPKVDVDDDGREIEFDYGDYEVEIKSKNGIVYVNYDD